MESVVCGTLNKEGVLSHIREAQTSTEPDESPMIKLVDCRELSVRPTSEPGEPAQPGPREAILSIIDQLFCTGLEAIQNRQNTKIYPLL